jgi:ribonuclease HI
MLTSSLRINTLDIPLDFPMACFDGATQINGLCSGVGGIIKLSTTTVYKWFLNYGKGTNTKAELMGAWSTLYLANLLSIQKIQIPGDSKIIIDWLNHKSDLQVRLLEGWKQRIRLLRRKFSAIHFFHIFREFNKEADGLSKQALIAPEGNISLQLWSGGMGALHRNINIY